MQGNAVSKAKTIRLKDDIWRDAFFSSAQPELLHSFLVIVSSLQE